MEKPNISTQSQTNLPPKPELTPSFSSPTPKFSPPLIATFVLFLVLVGAISFFLGKFLSQPKSSPHPISQVSPSPSPSTPTPTPDPTANWKTYKNEKYGFEFRYPQNLSYISLGPNSAQEEVDQGKEISGTVTPSFDTINFKGEDNRRR